MTGKKNRSTRGRRRRLPRDFLVRRLPFRDLRKIPRSAPIRRNAEMPVYDFPNFHDVMIPCTMLSHRDPTPREIMLNTIDLKNKLVRKIAQKIGRAQGSTPLFDYNVVTGTGKRLVLDPDDIRIGHEIARRTIGEKIRACIAPPHVPRLRPPLDYHRIGKHEPRRSPGEL